MSFSSRDEDSMADQRSTLVSPLPICPKIPHSLPDSIPPIMFLHSVQSILAQALRMAFLCLAAYLSAPIKLFSGSSLQHRDYICSSQSG